MRAYFFGNMYLSSIQQGIQAAHCTAELFLRYLPHTEEAGPLYDWAKNHMTTIMLNGGDSMALAEIVNFLSTDDNPYLWAQWSESYDALNSALTCVGIILPEKMYSDEAKSYVRSETRREPGDVIMYQYDVPELSTWEFNLIDQMNSCGLAR